MRRRTKVCKTVFSLFLVFSMAIITKTVCVECYALTDNAKKIYQNAYENVKKEEGILSKYTNELKRYKEGYNDGYNDGYGEGHDDGFDDGYERGKEEEAFYNSEHQKKINKRRNIISAIVAPAIIIAAIIIYDKDTKKSYKQGYNAAVFNYKCGYKLEEKE